MCGRYITKDQRALERELPFLDVKHWPKFDANYNIAPTQFAPVVIAKPEGNVCELMRFGLVPFFAKGVPGKYSTINARVETAATSPAYRGPWKRGQRSLVLASSFYEWQLQADGKSKQPYLIHLADQNSFAMAGLWIHRQPTTAPSLTALRSSRCPPHRSWPKSTTIRSASPRSWLARTVRLG